MHYFHIVELFSKFADDDNLERFVQQQKCSYNQAIFFLDIAKNNYVLAQQLFKASKVVV